MQLAVLGTQRHCLLTRVSMPFAAFALAKPLYDGIPTTFERTNKALMRYSMGNMTAKAPLVTMTSSRPLLRRHAHHHTEIEHMNRPRR